MQERIKVLESKLNEACRAMHPYLTAEQVAAVRQRVETLKALPQEAVKVRPAHTHFNRAQGQAFAD